MLVNLVCTQSDEALVDAHDDQDELHAEEQLEHERLRERHARRGTRPPARGARSGRRWERGRGRDAAPGMRRPFSVKKVTTRTTKTFLEITEVPLAKS